MVKDTLIAAIKRRFPDRRFVEGVAPAPIVLFPSAHEAVGDVMIYEDGDEMIVEIGKITHEHFAEYDNTLSREARINSVIEQILYFLEHLFADKILLWTSRSGAGGSREIRNLSDLKPFEEWNCLPPELIEKIGCEDSYLLWSGPIEIR